ncbi:hypothetical protein SPAN111604_08395 [Sphingomonas antarctica]|uniref:hypothetical protein n=1 Tax=Sphingomonas antarctica TaxID=2040274 RepID=UPI0039E75BCD
MKRRSVFQWLGLTAAISAVVPGLLFLSFILRMELVGDKPAVSGAELAHVEQLQWAVQLGSFLIGVAAFAWLVLVVLKRT